MKKKTQKKPANAAVNLPFTSTALGRTAGNYKKTLMFYLFFKSVFGWGGEGYVHSLCSLCWLCSPCTPYTPAISTAM